MGVPGSEDIVVQIVGSVGELVASMREAGVSVKESTAEMDASLAGASTSFEEFKAAAIAALAPLLAITTALEVFHALGEAIHETSELGEQLKIAGEQTGIAAAELSRLDFAAKMAGVSTEALMTGLGKLSRNLEEAAKTGKGSAADALQMLGIAGTTADGHLVPLAELLPRLAERFARMEDGAGKTALAMDLFGRGGAALIPLLNEGAKGIEELKEKADELGVTMDENGVAIAVRYNDEMKELSSVMSALGRDIAVSVMPALIDLAKWFRDTIGTVSHFADEIWRLVTGFSFIKQLKRDAELQAMIDRASKPTEPPKTDAPLPTATSKVPFLTLLREEWNKRKEDAIKGDEDLLQVELDFWREKIKLAKEGSEDYIAIHSKIVDTEEQIAKRSKETQKKVAKEWSDTFKGLPEAFNSAFRSMQNSAGGFTEFMRGLWYDLVAMSAEASAKMLADWAGKELAKKNITRESVLERVATETWGAVRTIAIKTWEALKWIAAEAAKAAASAWAAMAGIPYIGPALGIAAAAATLAGVLALAHNLGGGGGPGGGGSPSGPGPSFAAAGGGMTVNINAMDASSFRTFAERNPSGFAAGVKAAIKHGALSPTGMT
jgi:DNA-binding transcriptional ArsR family regulator